MFSLNTKAVLISGFVVVAGASAATVDPDGSRLDAFAGVPSFTGAEPAETHFSTAASLQSAPRDSASAQRKEMRLQNDRVKALLDEIKKFRPNHRAFVADIEKAQQDASEALEQFRATMADSLTADVVQFANDPANTYAARTAKYADDFANYTASSISQIDLDKFRNSTGRDDLAMAQYFLMAYREEQMNQLARLYPDREPIMEARKVAGDAMEELGSLASVKEGRAAALAQRIAATRLYPARRHDSALEAQFSTAFKSSIWSQQEFANSEVLKVNLTSGGWTVRRNPLTGIIISRDQQANLGVRRKDGRCFSYIITFEQKSTGGGYGGAYMAAGRDLEMLCENIAG